MHRKDFMLAVALLSLVGFCYSEFPQGRCETLIDAVKKDDKKQVLMLLDQGVEINCRGEYNYTPLITAARFNRIDIALALCNRGAEINVAADIDIAADERGYTPLLWAVNNCNLDMTELLIKRGAAVCRQGRGGDVPLVIAARRNCLSLAKILLTEGAAIDETDEENADTALIEAVQNGYLDFVDYLIEKGADYKRRDQAGRSLLSVAAFRGHFVEVIYLHEKGLSVNETDRLGRTAIFSAANDRAESKYILQYLIEHGASVSIKSADGTSPIFEASFCGANNAVGSLIGGGAKVNDKNDYRETPLQLACRGIRDDMNEDLEKHEATIKLLLNSGAQVNTQDRDGKSPLMEAALHNVPQIVEALIKRGAEVNAQDNRGHTALMFAADSNQTSIINILVKQGADLNKKNTKGETALSIAKKKKSSVQAYELLRSLGAKDIDFLSRRT